jgi:proton glutamate symport protein
MSTYSGWLLSPWAILAGMAGGVLIGTFNKELAEIIAPGGELFLKLLQMCIIPIMITAVSSSLARLFLSKKASRYIGRIVIVFLLGLLLSAGMGLLFGMIGQPGTRLDPGDRHTLGKTLVAAESGQQSAQRSKITPEWFVSLSQPLEKLAHQPPKFGDFFTAIIPENIFASLSGGHNMQILFFSILFGIALPSIPVQYSDKIITGLAGIFKTFENLIGWIMYSLPLGLCCLLAGQVARTGLDIMLAMVHFVVILYIGAFLLIGVNALIIQRAVKLPLSNVLASLRQTLVIAFGTRNGFVAIPAAIEAMSGDLGLDEQTTNLVIPLGITLCRFGTTMVFGLSTIFFVQLYQVTLSPMDYAFIVLGSVLAAIASAGAPGVVALRMLALVFTPLGLPLNAAITLLLAVDPVTDPILTLLNVHTNCAVTALIAKGKTP